MATQYDADNTKERERMRGLVGQLGDDQLRRAANAEWSVADVLSHLAFWDARVVYFVERWLDERLSPGPNDHEPEDVEWINDAAARLGRAIPPRAAAELAVSLAEEADRRVAALPAELVAANEAAGDPVHLARWEHRRAHLDEIELELAR